MQHEHPLQLVDLQPRYPDYVEFSDDEEEDRVIKWDFNHTCNQCDKDINVYHRYTDLFSIVTISISFKKMHLYVQGMANRKQCIKEEYRLVNKQA